MIAERRPWIAVAPQIAGDFTWTGEGDARVPIRFELTNIRKSSALRAWVDAEMHVSGGPRPGPVQAQRTPSERIRRGTGAAEEGPGFTIFPEGGAVSEISMPITAAEQAEFHAWVSRTHGVESKLFAVYLVRVVGYQSIFGEPHQTGFVFDLLRWEREHPNQASAFSREGGNVSPYNLLLRPSLYGTGIIF